MRTRLCAHLRCGRNGLRRRLFLRSALTPLTGVLLVAVATVLLSGMAFAQREATADVSQLEFSALIAPTRPVTPVTSAEEGRERVLFIVPAFEVTNQEHPVPYTAKQKFALASRQAFDPFMWVSAGIQAGMSQGASNFPEYGQGAAGYGKRYGAQMLDTASGGFTSTTLRVLLKQDPRYFRVGTGSIKHRVLYSLAQEFTCRGDNGKRQFNWSRILGSLSSAALANAYYPSHSRGVGLTMNRFAMSMAWDPTGLFTEEFWPDINRKFFQRRKTVLAANHP